MNINQIINILLKLVLKIFAISFLITNIKIS